MASTYTAVINLYLNGTGFAGSTVNISCRIYFSSHAEQEDFKWIGPSGMEVVEDNRITATTSFDYYYLTSYLLIKSSVPSDSGSYDCSVSAYLSYYNYNVSNSSSITVEIGKVESDTSFAACMQYEWLLLLQWLLSLLFHHTQSI